MAPQTEITDTVKNTSEVDVPLMVLLTALTNTFGEKISRGIFDQDSIVSQTSSNELELNR